MFGVGFLPMTASHANQIRGANNGNHHESSVVLKKSKDAEGSYGKAVLHILDQRLVELVVGVPIIPRRNRAQKESIQPERDRPDSSAYAVHRSASSHRISCNELWKPGPALSKPTRTNSANMGPRRLPFTPSANPSTLLRGIFSKNSHPSKAWRAPSGAFGFPG